jgi:hypothetical protein
MAQFIIDSELNVGTPSRSCSCRAPAADDLAGTRSWRSAAGAYPARRSEDWRGRPAHARDQRRNRLLAGASEVHVQIAHERHTPQTRGHTEVGSSHKQAAWGLSAIISVFAILVVSAYLMATRLTRHWADGDRDLGQEDHDGSGLTSVVMTFATEEEEEIWQRTSAPRSHYAEWRSITTGSRLVSRHQRNDLLRLEPKTTITIGEPEPATIIELLDGALHVKAGKRHDGETLSIETQYLVATVKGTEFMVATTDSGTAVSVTEGVVSVRSTHSSQAFDVVPGQTAVVSTTQVLLPTIVATPAGGWIAAIEAAVSGTAVHSNDPRH